MYTYRTQIVSVYDGDTVKADIDLGFGVILRHQTLRLIGIDAPEIRGKSRPEGIASRDALRSLIDGMTVVVKTTKDRKGKYGRWLAEIWLGEENVNQWMLQNRMAVPYEDQGS